MKPHGLQFLSKRTQLLNTSEIKTSACSSSQASFSLSMPLNIFRFLVIKMLNIINGRRKGIGSEDTNILF